MQIKKTSSNPCLTFLPQQQAANHKGYNSSCWKWKKLLSHQWKDVTKQSAMLPVCGEGHGKTWDQVWTEADVSGPRSQARGREREAREGLWATCSRYSSLTPLYPVGGEPPLCSLCLSHQSTHKLSVWVCIFITSQFHHLLALGKLQKGM